MIGFVNPSLRDIQAFNNYCLWIMAGLKNLIVNSKANISKRLGDGVMTQSRMEKNKEMIEDVDHAMKNNLNMEWKELSLSVLGISFDLSDFVAFLSWTGMCLYALLGLLAAALISLPMDLGQMDFLTRNLETLDLGLETLDLGIVLLLIAVLYFILNYLLGKKNKENNLDGVKETLKVICTVKIILGGIICVLLLHLSSSFLICQVETIRRNRLKSFLSFLMSASVFAITSLLLYGITQKERSSYLKVFLEIQYFAIYGPIVSVIAMGAFVFAAFFKIFSLFIIGVLVSLVLTFLFVFNIGFFVALHSIYLENENQIQLRKMLKI